MSYGSRIKNVDEWIVNENRRAGIGLYVSSQLMISGSHSSYVAFLKSAFFSVNLVVFTLMLRHYMKNTVRILYKL